MNRPPRILLLTEFYPSDPATCVFGAFQRLRRHIDALSRIGTVDAVFFWPQHDLSAEQTLRQVLLVKKVWRIEGAVRFVKVATGPRRMLERMTDLFWALRGAVGFFHTAATMRTCRREQAAALRNCLQDLQPDLIFAHRLGGFAPLIRTRSILPPVVVDIDDLEHVKLGRLAATIPDIARRTGILAQAWLALHVLRRVSTKADVLLVTSELDRAKVQAACRGRTAAIIPNSADRFGPMLKSRRPVACFVGTAAYPPNSEAILWLITEIWPLVRRAVPDARLLIAGEGTRQLLPEHLGQGIEGLGFVSDLAPIYGQATISVCPIRRGGGTRIKIIEAAINGRPVVSTTVGAEGLSFAPDTEILLDDSAEGFASVCIRLLQDPDLAATIGEAAHRRAEACYAPDRVADELTSLCAGLIDSMDRNGAKRADRRNTSPPASKLS